MSECKQSTACRLFFRVINAATGEPMAGIAYSSVTASIAKQDGTTASVTPASASDWDAVTFGAFSLAGTYFLIVPSGANNVAGETAVAVSIAGALDIGVRTYDVVSALGSDIKTVVDTLATAAAVATLQTSATAIKAKTDNLPTDPADASDVAAAITSATSPLATSAALTTVSSNVTSIKAKTDNLPSDPADASDVASAITSATSPLATSAALTTVAAKVTEVFRFHANRRKKFEGRKQMVVYADDGTTEAYVFDMKDDAGAAEFQNPVELDPV